MKASATEKIKTGVFVTVGLCIIIGIVLIIGKQQKLFSDTYLIHAHFKNVNGLLVGNFVRFGGINVGIVDNIVIENDTTIRVDLRMESRMKKYVKKDALASISSDGLMGDKLVQIAPGSSSSAQLQEGDLVASTDPVDMDKIIAKVTRIADNAETVTGSLAEIVNKVNSGRGSIGMLLKNDTLAKKLQSTVASANETVKSIKTSATKFNDNMDAAKHNFLLRGFFKKKEKQRIKDSVANAKQLPENDSKPVPKKDEKKTDNN